MVMPTDLPSNLLLVLLGLPFAAAILVAVLGPAQGKAIRMLSLAATIVNLGVAVALVLPLAVSRSDSDQQASRQAIPSSVIPHFAEPDIRWQRDLLPLSP